MKIEPTLQKFKKFKKVTNGLTYWHTEDFFPFKEELKESLYQTSMTLLDIENENIFTSGRVIVKAAREVGIHSREYLAELNSFACVMMTPVCIWYKDELGNLHYTLANDITAIDMPTNIPL